MPTPVIRYPLDTTGINIDNFVSNEPRTLPLLNIRAVAPIYGAFYADAMVITDVINNTRLIRGTHYTFAEMLQAPTALYGKDIYDLILIIDPNVSSSIKLDYQVLGGLYSRNAEAIVNIYNLIQNDTRPVNWPDIINKPSQFNPGPHLHDIGDVYGFEFQVNALERVRQAILLADVPAFEQILGYVDRELQQVKRTVYARVDQIAENFNLLGSGGLATNTQAGLMSPADKRRLDNALSANSERIKQYINAPVGGQSYQNTLSFVPRTAGRVIIISSVQRSSIQPGEINHNIVINGVAVDGDNVSLPSVGLAQTTVQAGLTCTIGQIVTANAPGSGTAISFGFVYIFIPAE